MTTFTSSSSNRGKRWFMGRNSKTAVTALVLLLPPSLTVGAFVLSPPRASSSVSTRISSDSSSTPTHPTQLCAKRDTNGSGNNPLQSIASSLVSAMNPFSSSNSPNPTLDATIASIPPTWDTIATKLHTLQTPTERDFRPSIQKGYDPPSPLHKIRLYDSSNKEEDIRVTFYRDSATWCPYCQKVWMTLEEKRIPYRITKVNMRCYGDKPRSFLQMQPNGNIPVAEIDGVIYNQSNDILYALEAKFPESKKLVPTDNDGRERAGRLLRLERQFFSAWMYWLTGNNPNSRKGFEEALTEVEQELASSPGDYFLGSDVSIVDFMFMPFLERMAASLLYFKGFQMRPNPKYPAVEKWFAAMERLDSYVLTKSDYYTHCWDLPPQLGGCISTPEGAPYENAINGGRALTGDNRDSWNVPLEPDLGGVEPDWNFLNQDENAAKREAVERLSANSANIVKFAARGAGKKGMPPVMAALSDPNASSSDAVLVSVDAVLRVVCLDLLGESNHDEGYTDLAAGIGKGGKEHLENVVQSLAYLRDRIGVPRDMRLPAARQLRAHLNVGIGHLLAAIDAMD
eukprot:CAMPEP_0194395272 /NCGR_PEP_ID=MMETSP0174-20130528/124330_1 /TAXON_ID=216777 /ORGANISM="Proboscia alata, Strain PI-D3" /LENGTH=569 /DNA_ID=CAMNT_0039191187 /DNA_START=749 /DNA_END=2458 /DNA_ORIENTATION=+